MYKDSDESKNIISVFFHAMILFCLLLHIVVKNARVIDYGIEKRKDQWTKEDDERLAEIVLHNVQNGKTQLEAFEMAAIELGRTKQACGFRWNKTLRGQYSQSLLAVRNQPPTIYAKSFEISVDKF